MNNTQHELLAMQTSHSNTGTAARQGRLIRVGVAVALLGTGLAVGMAAGGIAPESVEAENFILRDHDGQMRAALGIRPDKSPGLGFFDESGKVRLSLDLGKGGTPGVNLYDAEGTLQAAVAIRPDKTPGLGLFNKDGKIRLSLDLDDDGVPSVNLFDKNGRLRAAVAIRPDGTPGVGLFDNEGKVGKSFDLGDAAAPYRAGQANAAAQPAR